MQEMARLKQQLKDLNAKQIALNQEKAHLDAKAKAGESDDGVKFNNMELTLKQLREKVIFNYLIFLFLFFLTIT